MNYLDYTVLALYFTAMAGIGFWSMRRVKGQEDYFLGGRAFGKVLQTFAASLLRQNEDARAAGSSAGSRGTGAVVRGAAAFRAAKDFPELGLRDA